MNNGQYNSLTATVWIAVIDSTADATPLANGQTLKTSQGTPLPITLSGCDLQGLPLSYTILSQPSFGTLSGTAPNLTYTPTTTSTVTDTFTFMVYNGQFDSTPATIIIGVYGTPTANGQTLTTNENTPLPITLTGTDPQGLSLGYSIVTPPANGTLTGTAPNVTYTPNSGYSGTDSFTFEVNNGVGNSAKATISIKVTSTLTTPTADGQTLKTSAGNPVGHHPHRC